MVGARLRVSLRSYPLNDLANKLAAGPWRLCAEYVCMLGVLSSLL